MFGVLIGAVLNFASAFFNVEPTSGFALVLLWLTCVR
jgi:hypothetical protein